jgi:hypothetical protein
MESIPALASGKLSILSQNYRQPNPKILANVFQYVAPAG